MSKLSLPLLTLIALVTLPGLAQAQNAKMKLVGTWEAKFELDEAKLIKMFKAQGLNDDQIKQFLPAIKAQFTGAKMTLTLKADGTSEAYMVMADQNKKEKGTWEVVAEKGNVVTVKGKNEDGEDEETMKLEFDGNDKFTLLVEELEKAPLKTPVFERKRIANKKQP